jgi:RNA recognition motif-containing protein
VRSLPLNATETQLEDEFKKFGTIKQNGIQVRSNKVPFFPLVLALEILFAFITSKFDINFFSYLNVDSRVLLRIR